MSGQQEHSASPPAVADEAVGGFVRRHHTISAIHRNARPTSQSQDQEPDDDEHEQAQVQDDVVDKDWRGGIGAVGEKSSLYRQASLPTKYHRAFGGPGHRNPATTSMAHNSLTAIEGANEHEEEEWETYMRRLPNEDEAFSSSDHGHDEANASPLSQQFSGGIQGTSPPPASGAAVRRHQSLTYAAGGSNTRKATIGRSETIHVHTIRRPTPQSIYNDAQSPPSPALADEEFDNDSVRAEEDGYFRAPAVGQNPTSPVGQSSPWGTPGPQSDWRTQLNENALSNAAFSGDVDDVSRALSALELSQQQYSNNNFPPGGSRKLQLRTNVEQVQQDAVHSASAYVPPIGHGIQGSIARQGEDYHGQRERAMTASGSPPWDQQERLLVGRASNPNLQHLYQAKNGGSPIPNVPPIPSQFYNNTPGQGPRLGQSQVSGKATSQQGRSSTGPAQNAPSDNFLTSPMDVPTLIATKGYNPVEFDTRPFFAKYFVIKSYTEDDVHKSLKYEIWSSTDPGNKRLDKAFKENAGRGPIYLFFSVNASGHFCGMAEMLTPVDYTRSSTVWASDKWKGVFKVRWIFVRDIPNASLRHIRLQNTQERKPVTNSRDTQELLPEAGQEMLRIFHTHPARTSLLQDFAFYELQAMQKVQSQIQSGASSPDQPASSVASPVLGAATPAQHPFAMSNPAALAYAAQMGMAPMNQMSQMNQMSMMNPMLQMQMGLGGMNSINAAFANPQAMQSVLRQQSPNPMGNQNYMNMGGMTGI